MHITTMHTLVGS